MRILHVTTTVPKCGIAAFGYELTTALRRAGAEVTHWPGDYPIIYERKTYLPADADSYDLVHFNWHPGVLGHYRPEHLPKCPKSIYLHDLPPHSELDWVQECSVRLTSEPHPLSTLVVTYPVIDWIPDLPPPDPRFTVGFSGVRGDGLAYLLDLCPRYGWALNQSTEWLSIEDEIRRLARSTVNVCWYASNRGRASAASHCLASRRPLLINSSSMFAHLFGYPELYRSERGLDLREWLQNMEFTVQQGRPLNTTAAVAQDMSWSKGAEAILSHWAAYV